MKKKIIFIVGPTAVGKTDVAILVSKKIKGEIISCDSMQVYKELSIANNKPSRTQLRQVKHHLIGVVSVEEDFDVATYNGMALKAIEAIHRKGKVPLVVGGSGLYVQVMLDGIFSQNAQDGAVREKLKKQAMTEKGAARLYKRLHKVDPKAAANIHQRDIRRVIRALEVFLASGQRMSELKPKRSGLWGRYDIHLFVLSQERAVLYDKINQRVEDMLASGLLKEIQALDRVSLSKTAGAIIGIKEIRSHLDGEQSLAEAINLMKQNTRRLAKRQLTWFRKDKRCRWIMIGPDGENKGIAQQIIQESGL